jgi:hypothetical protein
LKRTDHVTIVGADGALAVGEDQGVVAFGEKLVDGLHVLHDFGHGRTDLGVLVPTSGNNIYDHHFLAILPIFGEKKAVFLYVNQCYENFCLPK